MARQVRIQFQGAVYHVMARGDRKESIIGGDKDRRMFIETLGEACEKTGWLVHAWVLMSNHYHLVLRTPQANLVAGMRWLQNTYTRRFNVRNQLWGHVFGGRYKAVLVECREFGSGDLRHCFCLCARRLDRNADERGQNVTVLPGQTFYEAPNGINLPN